MNTTQHITLPSLLDQLPGVILLLNHEYELLYANQEAKNSLGINEGTTLDITQVENPVVQQGELKFFTIQGNHFRGAVKTVEKDQLLYNLLPADKLVQAIIQLEESEHSLRNLIDVVPHAIFLKDSQRRFLIINKAVADHHKLDKVAMLGKKDEDFFAKEDAAPFIEDEEKILATKEPLYIPEESFTTDEGEFKVMETIKVPFYIQSSKEWGILGVAIDITQRKLLQEEQTRFKLQYQKDLMKAVVETQERERKKIAADLHDGLGQLLSAASLNLNAYLTTQGSSSNESLTKGQLMIENSIQEVRNITRNLMPNILKDFGLEVALEKLCEAFEGVKDLHFFFKAHNEEEIQLEEQVAVNIYRVAQEIINNALKHSQAEEIDIQLFLRDGELILQADDDGKGFDLDGTRKKGAGLGLKSIQNRVDLLNGTLDIETSPGRGCSYTIILKL